MGWSGGGSLRDLSKNILKRGGERQNLFVGGRGFLKVSPPLPPENFNHTSVMAAIQLSHGEGGWESLTHLQLEAAKIEWQEANTPCANH